MDETVRIIPCYGKPLILESEKQGRLHFPVSEQGFLVGPENRIVEPIFNWLVETGTKRVVHPDETEEQPETSVAGQRFPVLFYGPSGVGKTHLLRGIFTAVQNERQKTTRKGSGHFKAYYLTGNDFVRYFTEALQTRTTTDFRHRYRNAEFFVLDDLDSLREKEVAQEEFFFVFDELLSDGKTVLLSLPTFPGDRPGFSERLLARLLGGTLIPLAMPTVVTRRYFLSELAGALRFSVSESLLEYAAKELTVSLPTLYGIFVQMTFELRAEKKIPDITAAGKAFLRKQIKGLAPSIDSIAKRTAKHFNIKLSEIKGDKRNLTIAKVRNIAVYLSRELTGKSFKEIGEYFGGRDPSTIRHLVSCIAEQMRTNPTLRNELLRLQSLLPQTR